MHREVRQHCLKPHPYCSECAEYIFPNRSSGSSAAVKQNKYMFLCMIVFKVSTYSHSCIHTFSVRRCLFDICGRSLQCQCFKRILKNKILNFSYFSPEYIYLLQLHTTALWSGLIKKLYVARSDELGGWASTVMCFWAKTCFTESMKYHVLFLKYFFTSSGLLMLDKNFPKTVC